MKYDLFISHASEDKESFVRPLAQALSKLKVNVWYDEFSLKVGDSLSKSIDMGLINSSFGVVVLSKSFMQKSWTDYELKSLISKEIAYGKVILPIWHEITKDDLLNFSPFLVDKFALNSMGTDVSKIAFQLCEVVRPDIFENLTRKMVYEYLYEDKGQSVDVNISEIENMFPVRHEVLPLQLINRIKLMHNLFKDYNDISLEITINNFKHDTNPEREMTIWEAIAATYFDLIERVPNPRNFLTKKNVYGLLVLISYSEKERVLKQFKKFDEEIIELAFELFEKNCPIKNTHFVMSGMQ
ncbi:toll/interleukin-1 receptor domain-containing protein [Paenibacillus polymyxa]|uniref:toll/interleukin-1 receptor domain-containing protein n=1 Tax=Paenibacillus polymyxa TaxID=1406 RepID=UPI000EDED9AF|nr:toll/interleukin-1 receptor domain-containing protein [Paenibacillus polymyxa]MBY7739427.1 toll/interleukin-1 receptor domain-containing protein [Paenibacillus polymyxa]RGL29737.1 toll/interleukin-1 receptor domain-containing protein [Paenibacillus polymyxa]UMR34456.1 toll/interleukin-1 receptor domain-containing protein [Paenibacillus polymyxa]